MVEVPVPVVVQRQGSTLSSANTASNEDRLRNPKTPGTGSSSGTSREFSWNRSVEEGGEFVSR